MRDPTFNLVAWSKSNFQIMDTETSSFEFLSVSSDAELDLAVLQPGSDTESGMSDDYADMPELQSVSDSDSEMSEDDADFTELESVSDSDSETQDDEPEAPRLPGDLNETFEDRVHLLEGISWEHPAMKPPSRQIGDLLAEGAKALLEFLKPYPGDTRIPLDDPRREEARFEVLRASDEDYLIWDTFADEPTVLPQRLLREPNFELAAWYAARIGQRLGIPRCGKPKPIHRIPIDDLLALGSEVYFSELGRHEPDAQKVDRVLGLTCDGHRGPHTSDYLIMKSVQPNAKEFHIVPDSVLLNPKLDLLGWVRKMDIKLRLSENSFEREFELTSFGYFYTLFEQGISDEELEILDKLRSVEHRRDAIEAGLVSPTFLPSLSSGLDLIEQCRTSFPGREPLFCSGIQIPADQVNGIARTASTPRVPDKIVAKPLVIVVRVNG